MYAMSLTNVLSARNDKKMAVALTASQIAMAYGKKRSFQPGSKSTAGIDARAETIHQRIAVNRFLTRSAYTPARLALRRNGLSPMLARIDAAVSMNPARSPAVAAEVVKTSFIALGMLNRSKTKAQSQDPPQTMPSA